MVKPMSYTLEYYSNPVIAGSPIVVTVEFEKHLGEILTFCCKRLVMITTLRLSWSKAFAFDNILSSKWTL